MNLWKIAEVAAAICTFTFGSGISFKLTSMFDFITIFYLLVFLKYV